MPIHHPSPAPFPPPAAESQEKKKDATAKSISPALEAGALQRQRIVNAWAAIRGNFDGGAAYFGPYSIFPGPTPRRSPAVHSAGKGHSRRIGAVVI